MKNNNELELCPLCGSKVELIESAESWIECPKCKLLTKMHTCKSGAIEEYKKNCELLGDDYLYALNENCWDT